MQDFIHNYLGTVIVAAILAAAVIIVLVKLIKDKKAGKSSCGCEGCPNEGHCRRKDGCGRYGHKQVRSANHEEKGKRNECDETSQIRNNK